METASINSVNENRHEVVGKMIFATVPCLLSQSSEKFKTVNEEIIFDLAGIIHADSAGLALLLEWSRLAGIAKRKIKFVNVPGQLLKLTEVSGLNHILTLTGE